MSLQTTTRLLRIVALVPLVFTVTTLRGGGPLSVGGPTFGSEGQALVWDNTTPIRYWTDPGPLGAISNNAANTMLAQAFQSWAQVPTASLSFLRAGSIARHPGTIEELNALVGSCYSGAQT